MSSQDPLMLLMRSMCEHDSPGLTMAFKVEDFARQVHGDKLQVNSFQEICGLVDKDEEIPGFAAKDFDSRQFSKKDLSVLLESASGLLFKHCLPYFMETRKLHSQVEELETEKEEQTTVESSSSTLKLTQELADAQRKIISLQEQVIQLKDDIRSAENSAVTKTVQRDLKCYSAVLSQNCAVSMAPRKIQYAVRKATSSPEVEDRSSNLMIFGLPEETGQNNVEDSVKGVMESLNEKPVISKCSRVGAAADGKVRPVVVSLNSRETLISLLRKARELKTTTAYSKVFLEPDRTLEQRVERKRTLKTLSELRRSHPEGRYVIRGGVIQCV